MNQVERKSGKCFTYSQEDSESPGDMYKSRGWRDGNFSYDVGFFFFTARQPPSPLLPYMVCFDHVLFENNQYFPPLIYHRDPANDDMVTSFPTLPIMPTILSSS
jgi:hypothetical protein